MLDAKEVGIYSKSLSKSKTEYLDKIRSHLILHTYVLYCIISLSFHRLHITDFFIQAITPDRILKEQSPNGTCCAMCVTTVHPEMTSLQGLLAEFLATSILVLVVCSVFDRRNAHNTDSVSIKFGLTVAAVAMNEVRLTSGLPFIFT